MLAAVRADRHELEALKAVHAAISAWRGCRTKPGLAAVRALHPQLGVELGHNTLQLKGRGGAAWR